MTQDLEAALGQVVFLKSEPPEVLAELSELAVCRNYPKGNILYYHGDPGESMYVIVDGRVKVTLMNEEGREVTLALMRPGGLLGLVAALDDGPQIGNAIAISDCRLGRISRDAFRRWAACHPRIYAAFSAELAHMLRDAWLKVGEQALMPVKQRLLYALLDLAREEGSPAHGQKIVFRRPTHQELAELVGSSRVVVSRLLKELFEEEESIEAQGKVIRVSMNALVPRDGF